MIIRAVSDNDDDSDGDAHPLAPPPRAAGRVHVAKLAWLGVSLALAALLLADLAALTSSVSQPEVTRDAFALAPALLAAWLSPVSSLSTSSLFAAPATALNNLFGNLAAAAWIYSREATARRDPRGRSTTRWSWALAIGVLCFGHVVSGVYILFALFESDGDRSRFWLGKARGSRTYPRV